MMWCLIWLFLVTWQYYQQPIIIAYCQFFEFDHLLQPTYTLPMIHQTALPSSRAPILLSFSICFSIVYAHKTITNPILLHDKICILSRKETKNKNFKTKTTWGQSIAIVSCHRIKKIFCCVSVCFDTMNLNYWYFPNHIILIIILIMIKWC